MGVDIGDLLVKRPTSLNDYAGKWVAFDAWNILYQFLSNIRQPDGTPLMNQAGEITSHLAGTLYRTANLVEAGIKPIFVFDGEPHPLKNETLAGRAARRESAALEQEGAIAAGDDALALSKAKQTSKLSTPMADQAKQLLGLLGIPTIDAPSDGEALASQLCQAGIADATCSQDFDAVLFGAPTILRNLTVTGRRKLPGKQVWVDVRPEEIDVPATLDHIGLNRQQLVDVALLVGTDFNPGIKGIGPKKAVALVQKDGTLDNLLDRLESNPDAASSAVERALLEQHESLAERETIRSIFLAEPKLPQYEFSIVDPEEPEVLELMVNQFGFSKERVDGALKRFSAARSRQAQTGLFEY